MTAWSSRKVRRIDVNRAGIRIYTVAFGLGADTTAMQNIACCDDCENAFSANNSEDLLNAYTTIANKIIELQYTAQSSNVSGNVTTILYPSSNIIFNYTLDYGIRDPKRIPVTVESPIFNNYNTTGFFSAS